MQGKQILISSDHHANWDALEKLYLIAHERKIPFFINGDVIGDYNFETLAQNLGFKFPQEVQSELLSKSFPQEEMKEYQLYLSMKAANGDTTRILSSTPAYMQEQAKAKLTKIWKKFHNTKIQNEIEGIKKQAENEANIQKTKLRALYATIIKEHAKKLAHFIDIYNVKTYFLLGNHEPINFVEFVKGYLENPENLVDLGQQKGVLEINGIKVAGVTNVNAIMPFLSDIYSQKELDVLFPHQRTPRDILHGNVTPEKVKSMKTLTNDLDWVRIAGTQEKDFLEIDLFLTHGQIGKGAWRLEKQANEMPTLSVAAHLSHLSQLTVDGHLHTSHEMENSLGRKTIRAVGNKGYIISKKAGKIIHEIIEVDAAYDARGGLSMTDIDFEEKIMDEIRAHAPYIN